MKRLLKLISTAGVALALGATGANAATLVATIDGNDCSGVFGQGFANCTIPEEYDLDQSPVIAKFNFSDSGQVTSQEINDALFPSVDGTEFSFGPGMTWTYTPGPGDPTITFFVAKGGPSFNLFLADDELTDNWATPINPNNGRPYGLSHLTFYDTDGDGGGDVPEPMTLALVGVGLLGAGIARRRK